MPKLTQCLIDVKLANALNQFLYKAGMHKDAYKKLGFLCPKCEEPVEPHKGPSAHFKHVKSNPHCPLSGAPKAK